MNRKLKLHAGSLQNLIKKLKVLGQNLKENVLMSLVMMLSIEI